MFIKIILFKDVSRNKLKKEKGKSQTIKHYANNYNC